MEISLTLQTQALSWRRCRALIDDASSRSKLQGTFLGIYSILQSNGHPPPVKSRDGLLCLECDSYPVTYPVRAWEVKIESCRPWRKLINKSHPTGRKSHTYIGSDLVVPDHNSSRFPLSLILEPAEAETRLSRSFVLQPDDSACEPTIDVEHALLCYGTPADEWVEVFHRLTADDTTSLPGGPRE